MKIKKIKVIVWDIDGTLYQDIPQLRKAIQADLLRRVEKKMGLGREAAVELLASNYQKFFSTSRVLLKLGFTWSEIEARLEYCLYLKKQFLKKDPKLASVFSQLKPFRHLIASNNSQQTGIGLLKTLGLNPGIFEKIFGLTPTAIKPQLSFFRRILAYTDLPAEQHLFVGDREKTEIMPAKKLGMRTCLVWHVKSPVATTCLPRDPDKHRDFTGWGRATRADVSLAKIYDIVEIL